MNRHPSPVELDAWFDGEGAPEVCMHVVGCRRCARALARIGRARAVLRGEQSPSPVRRPHWVAALAPAAAGVALLFAAAGLPGSMHTTSEHAGGPPAPTVPAAPSPGAHPAPIPPPEGASAASAPEAASPVTGEAASTAGDTRRPRPSIRRGSAVAADPPATMAIAAASEPVAALEAPGRAALPADGLRVGVPVPVHGPDAAEGDEVLRAVRAVAAAAGHRAGAWRRLEVVAVPVDDKAARNAALARIDVLVGGFAMEAPARIPWLVPADTSVHGADVVPGEVGAEQAGAVLGADLVRRGLGGTVGAVVGGGPEARLADGLAAHLPVDRVPAGAETSCHREMSQLRRARVTALALSGPPELARRCLEAAGGWRPPGGVLVAPSAAYAGVERGFTGQGARTVLGFPTPAAGEPGADRFRRAVPGSSAYRALVSFAAAEILVDLVRTTGRATTAPARTGHWQSDLYDLDGGHNLSPRIVTARFGRWMPGP